MSLNSVCRLYLTDLELDQISSQFQSESFLCNKQVLWSGMSQERAQTWADKRGMQTLTTALGPLKSVKSQKEGKQRSKYMKGASALFAFHIAQGQSVTVLSPPPPHRFHPSGQTNYQMIEEPILKGLPGSSAVAYIYMVHPTVVGAEDFRYQIWPTDQASLWIERFKGATIPQICWRPTKLHSYQSCLAPNHVQAALSNNIPEASSSKGRKDIISNGANGLEKQKKKKKKSKCNKKCVHENNKNKIVKVTKSTKASTSAKVNKCVKVTPSVKGAKATKSIEITNNAKATNTAKVDKSAVPNKTHPSTSPANLYLVVATEHLISWEAYHSEEA